MAEKVKLSADGSSIDFVQSENLPSSTKKFRQSPEIEGFYRFIFENDLQREAFEILEKIILRRKELRAKTAPAPKAAPAKPAPTVTIPAAKPAKVAAVKSAPAPKTVKPAAKPAAKPVTTKKAAPAKPAAKAKAPAKAKAKPAAKKPAAKKKR